MVKKKPAKKAKTKRKKSKRVYVKLSPGTAKEVREVLKKARNEIKQKRSQLSIPF